MNKKTLLLAAAFGLSAFASAAPSAKETRQIVKEAYTFTYPLVMNYRTMYMQAIKGDGEFGKWLHLPVASPADTDIVTPNNDTPYSYAWLDLRAEPWVLTMPKIEANRFYTSQWDDLWGYVLDNGGSVNDGNNGGKYLLVSPSWKGEVPKGITRVIRGESDFLGSLTRTQLLGGKGDMTLVKEIQKGYKLQSLSAFNGTKAPKAAVAINWPKWTEGDETTVKYFDYVNFILPFTTPHADDKAMYAKLASIGLKMGATLDAVKSNPKLLKAFKDGIADARAQFKSRSQKPYDPADFFATRKVVGTDYINRAMGVYLGIFGNTTDQSVYLTEVGDSNGEAMDGSKQDYTVTFKAGMFPPVKYFWSFTMYKLPQRWLVDNPINRYAISNSTEGVKKNKDGSLTIYISKDSPGKDKESNWLPAPNGPFWVVLRTYGPSEEILNKSWKQPEYVPIPFKTK
ncbi:MAG: DUF1254 domain-containing protein [Lentisphaeria bacterium]|nr:DUF1254 domain-containing protein [Lentisphaeria bacterium]